MPEAYDARMRPVRPTLVALVLAASAALAPSADAVVPYLTLSSPGPITSLHLGSDLSCQVSVTGNPQPAFEPIGSELGDCGTYVLVTNTATGEVQLFGPNDRVFLPSTDQFYTPDTSNGPNGQQTVDNGTDTQFAITRVLLGTTGLALTRNEAYTRGQPFYQSAVDIGNSDPNVAYDVTITHLFLCYLQGGTSGDFGFHDLFGNNFDRPGCITGPGVGPSRGETLTNLVTPNNWAVIQYGDTGTLLRAGPLPNTCQCGESSDLMVGLSWTRRVDPGTTSQTVAWQTTVSGPQGAAAAPPPEPEKTGTASTESGTVRVQAPGGQFVDLTGTQSIPVGSLVDTTDGVVRLTAAASGAKKTRTGSFGGGVFRFTQKRQKVGRKRLLTSRLALRGGNFGICKTRAVGGAARRRVVRYLKAKASGRFSVIGKNSSGIERGTRWTTSDTCSGTLTAVQQGKVAVTDFAKRKTVIVRAGKSYLARGCRHPRSTCEPGTMSSLPSGQRTQALWPPS
jgi:hypothetical protein